MKDMEDKMLKIMLKDCNRKVNEFNEICNYLSQYSLANCFIIPKKYEKTIIAELEDLIKKTPVPLLYETQEAGNDNITLTIFNYGVMQRENILKDMGK